jgi:hypothetical protein
MPTKTIYPKKKPLLYQKDDDDEKVLKSNKKKIIAKKASPTSVESAIKEKAKSTKKMKNMGEPKNKTKRNPASKKV